MRKVYTLLVTLIFFSCTKGPIEVVSSDAPVPSFNNVIVLGNSLAQAGADPSIGWNADWGMAASKPEFDYVHLLTDKLQSINSKCTVKVKNIGAFEVDFTRYDYTEDYRELRNSKPDLIIIQIGENVKKENPLLPQFSENYKKLIAYFKTGNPDVKILAVGSLWGNAIVDGAMKDNSKFVTLRPLLNDSSNQAFGEYENYGVQIHPSDKGMRAITAIIYEGLKGI